MLCDCCPPEAAEGQTLLAVKTCLKCEVSLCAGHLQPHLERPAFSTHLLVDPLGDLSQRRCPTHTEILRYYCADERLYVCSDCLLDGGHAQHKVKALRQVEEDLKVSWKTICVFFAYECVSAHLCVIPQVILQALLSKAEEKLKDGVQILKEHEGIDLTMAVSKKCLRKTQHNGSFSRCSVHLVLLKL